ncbi:MAG: FliG C-terminal domain-containing protein [Pseudomonadota bacterium]
MNRSSPAPAGASTPSLPKPFLTKRRKAAIIVRLLLREGADLSLMDLPESMQIDLTHEMGALRAVDQTTLDSVVHEFLSELNQIGVAFPGGLEGALDEVAHAISPNCASRIRRDAGVPVIADPWGFLGGLDNEKLSGVLAAESTEIAAVILSKLPVGKSAEVLALLPADRARAISYAVSRTGVIAPQTVQSIGAALAEQMLAQPAIAFDDGPVGRLGAILNSSAAATREDVITGLEQTDQAFAKEVKKAIFTFSNIPQRIDPKDIPKITRAVDQGLLIGALAAAETAFPDAATYVLDNMSQRMAAQLRDEIEGLGPVKPVDGEAAMTAVIAAIRDMEAAGELALRADPEDA